MKDVHDLPEPASLPREQPRASASRHDSAEPPAHAHGLHGPTQLADNADKSALETRTGGQESRDTQGLGTPKGVRPQRQPKQPKPTFPKFLDLVKEAIGTPTSAASVRAVQKLLRGGFTTASSLDPLVNELLEVMKGWPGCSRLALELSVQTRTKRASELIRRLRDRLIDHSRSVVAYPFSRDPAAARDEPIDAIGPWLERRAIGPNRAQEERSAGPPDVTWARWAVVCLMEEPRPVRTEGICRILESLCPKHPRFDPGEAETAFFSEVAGLLKADKLMAGKLTAGLQLAAGARALGAATRRQLQEATVTVNTQSGRLRDLGETVKSLQDSLATATARITDQEAQLRHQAQLVEQERTERALDKEHWEALAEQQLTKKMNEVSGRLSHEIAEAKICLSDDAPNLRMALDRLREMERALTKLRGV